MAAVSELRTVHGDQVDFVIVPAEETARRGDEIERYVLSARRHGLVAFEKTGEPVFAIAGHDFGKAEIELALRQVTKN